MKKYFLFPFFFVGLLLMAGLSSCEEKDISDDRKTTKKNVSGIENGYEYVDLGLPSGLKWATCNVGSSSPEDLGDYFAWGETSPKFVYDLNTYFDSEGEIACIKYNLGGGKTILAPEDDAATVNMGGKWRMPTKEEWQELIDECTWEWSIQGRKGTGPNGQFILLPQAGVCQGSNKKGVGTYGCYWTRNLSSSDDEWATYYIFWDGEKPNLDCKRYDGLSVRGVFK
jgi:hypothetical protein